MNSKLVTGIRLLLGLMLVVFGLNGFLNFIPQPAPPEAGVAYFAALMSAGVMPLVKALEVIVGVLLLANFFVPLALVLLAPIAVNAVLYHAALDPGGIAASLVMVVMLITLLFAYLPYYRGMLTPKAVPGGSV